MKTFCGHEESDIVGSDEGTNYCGKCAEESVKEVWWCGTIDKCDLCGNDIEDTFIDGATTEGPWAIMCEDCHFDYGDGLGIGKGQRYEKKKGGYLQTKGGYNT